MNLILPRRLIGTLALLSMIVGPGQLRLAAAASPGNQTHQIVTGYFAIIHGDPMPSEGDADQTVYSVTESSGKTTWLTFSERLRRLLNGFERFNGKRVQVWIQRNQADRPGTLAGVQAGAAIQMLAAPNGAVSSSAITGSKPWISVLCKFPDVSSEPKDLNYFEDMFDSTSGRLDHYWREVSYDNINIVGSTAIDWVTLPHPQTYYIPTPGDGCFGSSSQRANLSQLFADCTAAADPFVDFSNGGQPFEGINLMFNSDLDGCAWGGSIWGSLDGVSKVWRTTWEPPWGYRNVAVMAHEMGHGFGLPHSNNADQDSSPYDNPWDVMSDSWHYVASDPVYGVIGKHTISYHKNQLGWILPSERFEPPGGGSYTITIDQLELPSVQNYRMAILPIEGTSSFYTVETRARVAPYDSNLPSNAVVIHEIDPGRREPAWLVDVDSPPNNYGDGPGVMWTVGETFEDPANQISVTVNRETAEGFEVTITSGARPWPPTSLSLSGLSGG